MALRALVLAGAAVVLVAVGLPRVAGATPYAVLSGSMSPSYPVGTLVVVRPTAPEDIRVGDVLTYQLRSGEPTTVTHRVVATSVSTTTGEMTFRTRGDANAEPDPDPVRAVQVRGTLWYAVPHLGRLGMLMSGRTRGMLVDAAAMGLLVYAASVLVGRKRPTRRSTSPRSATVPAAAP